METPNQPPVAPITTELPPETDKAVPAPESAGAGLAPTLDPAQSPAPAPEPVQVPTPAVQPPPSVIGGLKEVGEAVQDETEEEIKAALYEMGKAFDCVLEKTIAFKNKVCLAAHTAGDELIDLEQEIKNYFEKRDAVAAVASKTEKSA